MMWQDDEEDCEREERREGSCQAQKLGFSLTLAASVRISPMASAMFMEVSIFSVDLYLVYRSKSKSIDPKTPC